jgi:hypothetical protein
MHAIAPPRVDLIFGARLCPQDQPQRSAVNRVLLGQYPSVGEALRLVFQTQPRSVEPVPPNFILNTLTNARYECMQSHLRASTLFSERGCVRRTSRSVPQ